MVKKADLRSTAPANPRIHRATSSYQRAGNSSKEPIHRVQWPGLSSRSLGQGGETPFPQGPRGGIGRPGAGNLGYLRQFRAEQGDRRARDVAGTTDKGGSQEPIPLGAQTIESMTQPFDRSQAKAQFTELFAPYGAGARVISQEFNSLYHHYQEDQRSFHKTPHLGDVLHHVDLLEDLTEEPNEVRMAGWYHDVEYDPSAMDNEEKSAQYAGDSLRRLKVPEDMIQRVQKLIRMTQHHLADRGDADAQVLADADFAILGSPPEVYDLYRKGIYAEYKGHPTSERIDVLQRMLKHPRLYYTGRMYLALEQRARANLRRELAELRRKVL